MLPPLIFFWLLIVLFDRRFAHVGFSYAVIYLIGEFSSAVIFVYAVLLLLDIGKLCIAEAAYSRMLQKNLCKTFVAYCEFLKILYLVAVAPALFTGL